MSDSNRVALLVVKEASFGVLPGTPAFQFLRFTSEGLKTVKDTTTSDEIRSDRQTADIIELAQSTEGDINGEVTTETWDELILAGIQAAALSSEVVVLTAGTASVIAASDKFTHATAWDITPTVGQIIRTEGFTNAGNNGFFKVATGTDATNIIVENSGTLVDEGPTTAIEILESAQALNGVQQDSFCFEKRHLDLTNIFEQFYGSVIGGFNVDIPADAKTAITFSIMGQKEVASGATVSSSTVDANEYKVMSAANNLKLVAVNGVGICMMSGNIEVQNNLYQIKCAGDKYPNDLGSGSFNVSGSLEILFTDHTHKDTFLNHTESSLIFAFEDSGGRGWGFELPATLFTDEGTLAEGKDGQVLESISYEAKMDGTENTMIRYFTFTA